jgi:hypothetical protein
MVEDWEDWECNNFTVPVLNINNSAEQIKRLEERKLIEESDNLLTKQLFVNNEEEYNNKESKFDLNTIQNTNQNTNKEKTKNKISKQMENELKQKEISTKIKQIKIQKQKHIEIYGETNCDYDDYDYDKYYKY